MGNAIYRHCVTTVSTSAFGGIQQLLAKVCQRSFHGSFLFSDLGNQQ
jgi:hypothetical protein